MKLITLTQGKFAQVDDWNYASLNQYKWCANRSRGTYYAMRNIWVEGKQKQIKMHRLIMNTPEDKEVDHQDHNGLNCQEHNMRNATHSQNHMNKKPRGDSKYLGVSWDKSKNRWRTYIQTRQTPDHKRKTLYSGTFKTEIEAALAYNEKAREFHGEFANLNIIV